MKAPGPFKKFLTFILIAVIAVPPPVMADTASASRAEVDAQHTAHPDTLEQLVDDISTVFNPDALEYPPQCADDDPFFLRAQSWQARDDDAVQTGSELRIADEGVAQDLVLSGDWDLSGATDRWLLLSPRSPELFARCTGQALWSGLFAIDRLELAIEESSSSPVPLYFLPMPDQAWAGPVRALEIEGQGLIFVTDGRAEPLVLEASDIESLVQAQRFNLLVVRAAAKGQTLPQSRSTFGFGMSVSPEIVAELEASLHNGATTTSQTAVLERAFDAVFAVKTAYAQSGDSEKTGPKAFIGKLVRVGVLMGVALGAAFVLKITMRKELRARRASSTQRAGWKQNTKEVLDLFAANLNVLNYTDKIAFANAVEFLLDRYASGYAASKSSVIRKVVNETVLWTARSTERVPVNWRTLLYGVFLLGAVQSALFAGLCFYVFPEMLHQLGAVEVAKEAQNSDYATNETARNAASSVLSGPGYFSQEMTAQALLKSRPRVEKELRSRRLDPHDERNAAEYKRLLDQYIEQELNQMELPLAGDFLFDFVTLWNKWMRAHGYGLPEGFVASQPLDKYLGLLRPGLVIPVAHSTTARLQALVKNTPSDTHLKAALKLAKEIEVAAGSGRSARQHLIALTSNGPLNERLKNLPKEWIDSAGIDAAKLYANEYRKAFLSIVEGEQELLTGLSTELRQWLDRSDLTQAIRRAEQELIALYKDEWAEHRADPELFFQRHRAQLEIFTEEQLVATAKNNKDQKTAYQPPRSSWFVRWQKYRSLKHARTTIRSQADTDLLEEAPRLHFKRQVRESMMRVVGLYPDYQAMPGLEQRVEQHASASTEIELSEPKLKQYLESLSVQDALEFEALIFAEHCIREYVQLSVSSTEADALNTARPDRFSWLRQRKWIKKSRFVSRCLRAISSVWPEEAHNLGFRNLLYRTVPFLYDAQSGFERFFRVFITAATGSYLWNWWVLDAQTSYEVFLLSMSFYFMYKGPLQWLTRLFKHMGTSPMNSVTKMAAYSAIFALVTNFGSPIIMALEPAAVELAAPVRTFVTSTANAAHGQVVSTLSTCSSILLGPWQ